MSDGKRERWGYIYFEERSVAPARDWLNALPNSVRDQFRDIVRAVLAYYPPYGFPPSQMWQPMKRGAVDMTGFCEARDKLDNTLYRLFCHFDSRAPEHGLSHKVLVLLHGVSKPNETAVPDMEYRAVLDRWTRYREGRRRLASDVHLSDPTAPWP